MAPNLDSTLRALFLLLPVVCAQNGYYPASNANFGYPSPPLMAASPDIIDNEVTAQPDIKCTDRGVFFQITTRNPFRGNIYVQGQFGLAECRREFYNNDAPSASIELPLGDCGMLRSRAPTGGMAYSLTVITNFHPRFVTRVDRAYRIHCSYQHAERPVGVDLAVGSVTPEPIQAASVMMPDCVYTMRVGDVNGPEAPSTVNVGDLIYHRWECRSSDVYGMLVKNCRVFDGGVENVTLIDDRGCPTHSGVIQSPPVYNDNLNLAYAPVLAFHFPDRTQMNFRCQIQACSKVDNECLGLTPPNCPQNYATNQAGGGYSAFGGGPPTGQAYPTYPPNGAQQSYVGAGFSPAWPQTALPVSSVLQGNPSQVLQGIGRPWPRRRMAQDSGGQEMEHRILLATQQLRRNENGTWPPSLVILNKTSEAKPPTAGARRFFRPVPGEQELRQRQRRADEKTQDVVASSNVVNDGLQGMEWTFENGKAKTRPRPLRDASVVQMHWAGQALCLDRSTLVGIVAVVALLGAFSLALLGYVLWDVVCTRYRCGKRLISWRGERRTAGGLLRMRRSQTVSGYSPPMHSDSPPPCPLSPVALSSREEQHISNEEVRERQGPRDILAGILNSGMDGGGQRRKMPPPVPPKHA